VSNADFFWNRNRLLLTCEFVLLGTSSICNQFNFVVIKYIEWAGFKLRLSKVKVGPGIRRYLLFTLNSVI
jgi:hypothetical protein